MEKFVIFFVNKNGLRDFLIINAPNLKEAIFTSELFSKVAKCEILGVCLYCFDSFKLDSYE